jgi:hypothetical protein
LNSTPREYLSTLPYRDQPVISYLTASISNPFYGLHPLYVRNTNRANLLRPYPHFSSISTSDPVGYSWYHSLQVRAARRMMNGFTATVGYAWSKSMQATSFLNETDATPYEELSASHRPHRLTVNGVWEIPVGRRGRWFRDMSRPLEGIFGGWQLSAVVVRQAGAPLAWSNIIFTGDPDTIALPKSERDVDRWFNTEAGFNRISNQALSQNIRTFPTRLASVQADGQAKWDVTLTKSFRVSERSQVRFRAQCFNIMNHPNFGAPQMNPTNTAFGRITTTQGPPRAFQFALTLTF